MDVEHLDQIECRWRTTRDLCAIASSLDGKQRDEWFTRLAKNARPPQPIKETDTPKSSALYRVFPDGTAAFIWRHHDMDAIPLDDSGNRRPLVARIVVGRMDWLDPDVAMALCRKWKQSPVSPRSGQVLVDARLPRIELRQLRDLVVNSLDALDSDARKETGLDRLIAAALRDQSQPLDVQLPAAEIGEPATGPQVPLLRGLWCTTQPLLAGLDGSERSWQRWSFSTYEPPLGDAEPRSLPFIVFRADRPTVNSPQRYRAETKVPARAGALVAGQDDVGDVAIMLAAAYGELGGHDLVGRLCEVAGNHDSLDARLREVRQILRKFQPSSGHANGGSSRRTDSRGLATEASGTGDTAFRDGESSRYQGQAPPDAQAAGYAGSALPAVPDAHIDGSWTARQQAPFDVGSHHQSPGQHRFRVSVGDSDDHWFDDRARPRFINVLNKLSIGPADPEFMAVLAWLKQLSPPAETVRAQARARLVELDWCINAFLEHDRWHVEDPMEELFRLTVIPDLAYPAVRAEIANWAFGEVAQGPVIRALAAAAHHDGSESVRHLLDTLSPVLARRWLDDHGIYFDISDPPSPTRRDEVDVGWRRYLMIPLPAAVAAVLPWLCVALTLALILTLKFKW
jgi:hypothetical protein